MGGRRELKMGKVACPHFTDQKLKEYYELYKAKFGIGEDD